MLKNHFHSGNPMTRYVASGSLFLPTTGMNKSVVFHGWEYSGRDGMVILTCQSTGEVREISPAKALYIANEMHRGFLGPKETRNIAVDSRDRSQWDNALRQIYAIAKEQEDVCKRQMDDALSPRRTRGKYGHLGKKGD